MNWKVNWKFWKRGKTLHLQRRPWKREVSLTHKKWVACISIPWVETSTKSELTTYVSSYIDEWTGERFCEYAHGFDLPPENRKMMHNRLLGHCYYNKVIRPWINGQNINGRIFTNLELICDPDEPSIISDKGYKDFKLLKFPKDEEKGPLH